MERPNTVAGLIAKRAELVNLRKDHEREARKLTCDIDHLDAAIALFDPESTPRAVQRYAVKHRAKKGTVQRFVLAALREATAPLTSQDITRAWVAARGLRADEATFVLIRKRIGACLTGLRSKGTLVEVPQPGDYKGWLLNPIPSGG